MALASITDGELLAWLDEQLPVDRMAAIEKSLRDSEPLRRHVASLARRRDQGGHSVGEIWRRLRLSCPSRAELGSFLLGSLDADHASYVTFHVQTIGCRFCLATLDDMQAAERREPERETRRKRIFESSAGLLGRESAGAEEDVFGGPEETP